MPKDKDLIERLEILETKVRGMDGLTNNHGKLGGLTDDDHTGYHTDARGDARYIEKDGTTADISGDIPLNSNKLTGVTDPTANQDAATKKYVDDNKSKFGGTGADGAKTVSSSENIDFDSANVAVKNYTTLTINASQVLGATNVPATGGVMWLKVSGDCVISGKIDIGGKGGAGGAGGLTGGVRGTSGTAGYKSGIFDDNAHYGTGGSSDGGNGDGGGGGAHQSAGSNGGNSSTQAAPGVGGVAILTYDEHVDQDLKAIFFVCGSGAGGGGADGDTLEDGGAGGAGAGVLILEVAGNLTFGASSTLDADGDNGADGIAGGDTGGGGGGSGGQIYVLYNGTLTDGGVSTDVGGGTGGAKVGNGGNGGAGGAGDYYIVKNHSF